LNSSVALLRLRQGPRQPVLASLWLLLVLAATGHNLWLWFGGNVQLETDVLLMLPQDEQDPLVQQVTRQLSDAVAKRVVVAIGASEWPRAQAAADAYVRVLKSDAADLQIRDRIDDSAADQWLSFYARFAPGLLTEAQRRRLQNAEPAQLAAAAVEALFRPVALPRAGRWLDDPLNLFSEWLTARTDLSQVRLRDGRLSVSRGAHHYVLLVLSPRESAFSGALREQLVAPLDRARTAARAAVPELELHVAGVPLFAAAAASQAEKEVHTIGAGSLIGVVILTLFAFSAIRPRLLITVSIVIGLLAAVSVSSLVFGKLHLITLVFGASLVGVAENYGTNYYTARLGRPVAERWAMLREQAPTMWLAMLTTVIGYALLATTPFPGLAQMAVFSAVGLLAAFFTVMLFFPLLDRGDMPYTRFAAWLGDGRARWPQFGAHKAHYVVAALTLVFIAVGLLRLQPNDDIRQLQNLPADLLRDQKTLGQLVDMPSPAQFYLVRGSTPEQVLQREEALKTALQPLLAEHWLRGVQAVSDSVPSVQQQQQDLALQQRVIFAEQGVLAHALALLGESEAPTSAVAASVLHVDEWLASPVSEPSRHQWLGRLGHEPGAGYASVVMLRGIDSPQQLPRLAAVADQLTGVQWVDKVAEVSRIMARYRVLMSGVIALAYGLVWLALMWRFGRSGWRALLPTALASVLSLALLGWLGLPLQLFNVLALLLILSLGVDYGIFMLAQPDRHLRRPFLSITLAAASTLLAFGLLALSSTPALRAFGLTMLIGVTLAWLLTPLFLLNNNRLSESKAT